MALLGKCVVFGAQGTVAFTGVAAADNKVQGLSIAGQARQADARDGLGRIFASSVELDASIITVDIIPFDADGTTLAQAHAACVQPVPGATLTLASFGSNIFDGSWNILSPGTLEIPANATAPVIIRGITARRVSTDGSTVAAQSVIA